MATIRLNFAPFISYHKIKVNDIDLFEDAWGLKPEYDEVIALLRQINGSSRRLFIKRLFEKIRKGL
jgi:hypothetical protein